MGHRVYHISFATSGATARQLAALNNPAASGVNVLVHAVHAVARTTGRARFKLSRYSDVATGGTAVTPAPHRAAWAAAAHVLRHDSAALTIVGSSTGLEHLTTSESAIMESVRCSQTDEEPSQRAIMLAPGESLVIELLDAGVDTYTVMATTEEHDISPSAHIASSALPGASAYTSVTYFDLPDEWTALTFLLSYTADAISTGAKPQWRVSWSDGTNDFIQPIVGTSLDTASPPVASRSRYQCVEVYPTTVSATNTVRIAIDVDRLPGMSKVRLDVSELGDAAHPGTIVVSVTGQS